SLGQIIPFTHLLSVIKNNIVLCQPICIATDTPPPVLPPSVRTFISNAAEISFDSIPKLWGLLKEDVWSLWDTKLSAMEENLFWVHGWKLGITSMTLYPPTHHCQNTDFPCINPLKKPEVRQVVIYTQGNGAIPVFAVHLYCPDCNTNYHPNFSVHAGMRTYYSDKPTYIQIGEHQFAEQKLVGLWVTLMLMAWYLSRVSATNCAWTYDMALSGQQEQDFAAGGWQFG
ncbi:hypothetical protein B0H19DRAFT_893977, partial [Mycena capillaripes]